MPEELDQENRLLSISTPLGDNVLVLQSFAATEAVSKLFAYECELLSSEEQIAPADIVGQRVTITLRLEEGGERFFDGFVNQFSGGAMHSRELRRYRAEVVPWFWFMTRSADCRIFQEKTVPDIIEELFGDFGFSDYELDLQGNHPEREYCVQYRESAFNFLSRLMEEEGMFYWFRHEDGTHTLVIADHTGAYVDCPENEIEYHPGSLSVDHISQWEHRWEYCSGKSALADHNFKTPSADLVVDTNTLIELPNIGDYELYDYPGEYTVRGDGEELVRVRMEEEEVAYDMVHCVSGCRTLHTLGKFTVTRHECPSEENKGYMITEAQHSASDYTYLVDGGETSYDNSFSCIPEDVVFRPERTTPKPEIVGPQTAVVVGPAGEEIYPDEFGRVKVQFHWDRRGNNDENSSCWTRVSQTHAGNSFGAIHIPRIGEEVIVEFLEGDPDRPIITGRVYNAEAMPPFGLPGSKVISGMKSNSTLGGGGYNEYVFDDSKGNELIREHGQFDKDSTIENDLREHVLNNRSRDVAADESVSVGNNRTKSVGTDEKETIGSNKTIEVGVDHKEKIGANMDLNVGSNQTVSVGANQNITVGSSKNEKVLINTAESIGAAKELSIGGLYQISVGAAMNETVGAAKAEEIAGIKSVNVGANSSENIGGKKSVKAGKDIAANAGGNISESAGKDVTVTAGKQINMAASDDLAIVGNKEGVIEIANQLTIKCGSASIVLKKNGDISIKGKEITIKGSGDIVMKGSKIKEN